MRVTTSGDATSSPSMACERARGAASVHNLDATTRTMHSTKRNLPVADAGATSESSLRRGVSPPSYLSYSSLLESALAGSTDP